MSIVKAFAVGNGDTFYIRHDSDNFTMIDCCLDNTNKEKIVDEIIEQSSEKGIHRFISTHPDEDHIQGLEYLNSRWNILNFYCVENKANKQEPSTAFKEYCRLRDDRHKAFYLFKGCARRWLNEDSESMDVEQRRGSDIRILWPEPKNIYYQEALQQAKMGGSPNNISPIIIYGRKFKFMWMGDLEADFLDKVSGNIEFERVDVLFAPHHGRQSGKIPKTLLDKIAPRLIIIGEAPSENLNYYQGFNTITQNTARDIIFCICKTRMDVYVENANYAANYEGNSYVKQAGYHIYSLMPRN